MKIYAVFGNPILHSRSPQLFNSVFSKLRVDAFYTRIRPQSAQDIVDIIGKLPLAGANITAPFKEEVLPLLNEISPHAQLIGAVNTIVNQKGHLIGYNTDPAGVTETLRGAGVSLAKSRCLVLGGGGAARAAVYGLKKSGADVYICNRTLAKAQAISTYFGCHLLEWMDFNFSIHFDVVVSTLLPEAMPPFLSSLEFRYLLDAAYQPSAVREFAKKRKAVIIDGKWWLINQAVASYELFIGNTPSAQIMESAFNQKLQLDKLYVLKMPMEGNSEIEDRRTDLIVSANGKSISEIMSIVDEETRKAFGR